MSTAALPSDIAVTPPIVGRDDAEVDVLTPATPNAFAEPAYWAPVAPELLVLVYTPKLPPAKSSKSVNPIAFPRVGHETTRHRPAVRSYSSVIVSPGSRNAGNESGNISRFAAADAVFSFSNHSK